MNISFWLPHVKTSGGVRVILTYADLLAKRGHAVSVVIEVPSIIHRIAGSTLRRGVSWFPHLSARIIRVASWDEAPVSDVTIADSWQVARALEKSTRTGSKLHFIQHDERLYHGDPEKVARVYSNPIPKIAVSTWLQEVLERDLGQKSELLLNSVDRSLFYPVPRSHESTMRILLLHHEYPWKGTAEGVHIVERLREKHPQIRLIMFGTRSSAISFRYDEYYYNLPQSRLRELYSSSDVYLSSSWDEGSGLPSLEAMACGTAVVTYNNGGSRDYAVDGKTAFVAPHRNENVLFECLRQCVEDLDLRKRIARGGHEKVLSMPTWSEQTDKLEALCKS